jgi:hypothetical protein
VPKALLTVIKGDAQALPEWVDLPQTIVAKSPGDRHKICSLRVSKADVAKAARREEHAGKRLTSLVDAGACFRGIKRPLAEDDDGDGMIAYVLKPKYVYRYQPSLVCVANLCEVPSDLVFVAFARLDAPRDLNATGIIGLLTHWGFFDADPQQPHLPIDFAARYTEALW